MAEIYYQDSTLHQYREYVKWRKHIGAHPIGLVPWRNKRYEEQHNTRTP